MRGRLRVHGMCTRMHYAPEGHGEYTACARACTMHLRDRDREGERHRDTHKDGERGRERERETEGQR